MSTPNLWELNPFLPLADHQTPKLISSFPGYLGLLGIVEIEHDIFAVISGNFSLERVASDPGSYAVWRVDLQTNPSSGDVGISKIEDIPEASFLNGMAYLPAPAHALLMADSTLGVIFRLDLQTLVVDVAIDVPEMKKCSEDVLEGINGLRVSRLTLYFTNAYCGILYSLPITPTGEAAGPVKTLAHTSSSEYIFDDFAVGEDGTVYLATGTENVITEVLANGETRVLVGNLKSTEVAEPTSLVWGRTERDRDVLYVTTGGGLGGPVNGTVVVGGQVLCIDLGRELVGSNSR